MKCAVRNCRTTYKVKCTMFSFPSEPVLRKKWTQFCRQNKGYNFDTSYMCIEHFVREDIENILQFEMGFAKKRILKREAVPSIYKSSGPERLQRVQGRRDKEIDDEILRQSEMSASHEVELIPYEELDQSDDDENITGNGEISGHADILPMHCRPSIDSGFQRQIKSPKTMETKDDDYDLTIVTIKSEKSDSEEDEIALAQIKRELQSKATAELEHVERKFTLPETTVPEFNEPALVSSNLHVVDDFIIYEIDEVNSSNIEEPTVLDNPIPTPKQEIDHVNDSNIEESIILDNTNQTAKQQLTVHVQNPRKRNERMPVPPSKVKILNQFISKTGTLTRNIQPSFTMRTGRMETNNNPANCMPSISEQLQKRYVKTYLKSKRGIQDNAPKCIHDTTYEHSTIESKLELKDYFERMFEITRQLKPDRQQMIKIELLKAVSAAEIDVEAGMHCKECYISRDAEGENEGSDKERDKKKRKRFLSRWLEEPFFRDWLEPIADDEFRCKCKICDNILQSCKADLRRHAFSFVHRERAKARASQDNAEMLSFGSSASDTSDGGNESNALCMGARKRMIRDKLNLFEIPEREFMRNFGVSKQIFRFLLNEVSVYMGIACRITKMTPAHKLAVFLRFLATGSHQKGVGDEYIVSMSQAMVSIVIQECLNIFETHFCPKWIKLEMTAAEERETKESFYEKCGIPGIVGCVDGIHVKIICPSEDIKHLYYNRKGYYCINALIICDHTMTIRHVDASKPGAKDDAFVWSASRADVFFKSRFESGKLNTWLLGDSGYQLMPYLMTPSRNTVNQNEIQYNAKLSEGRKVIQKCFGILKSRFRCIIREKGLRYSPEKTAQIINVCCALHNVCIHYNDEWILADVVDNQYEEKFGGNAAPGANYIRQRLADCLL